MSLVEKKNCWWLTQHAGHDRPGSMQRLLGSARLGADIFGPLLDD